MIDPDAVLIDFALQEAGITALAGRRVYAARATPKGYKPEDGPALLLAPRGGRPDYSGLVLDSQYQFRSFAKNHASARELDWALFQALQDRSWGDIKMARMESIGQALQDTVTGWPFVLSLYRIFFNNS